MVKMKSTTPTPVHSALAKLHKTFKTGVSAVKLHAKMANPINKAKFIINAAKGKGFTLPGSNYIGPGNPLLNGPPTSKTDAAARLHDYDYDRLIKQGVSKKNLYLGFSRADQRLLDRTDTSTPEGLAVTLGMSAKKLAQKVGLTGKIIDD